MRWWDGRLIWVKNNRNMRRNFQQLAKTAYWQSVDNIKREFVRYSNPEPSPGEVWHEPLVGSRVQLSVVIPTSDAYRGGYFEQLLKQISEQSLQDIELIVVKGDPRQGRAINICAALSSGPYMLTLDDDTSLPDNETFLKMLAVMKSHPDVGMAGGNNTIPDWVTPFVKQVMQQLPRRSWEPVTEITDSDLAEHPCVIMRTAEFKTLGGENELIPRGLDPYLRQVFRESGKRVVVVPDVIYHHLPPDSWSKLLGQFFRNGRQAAYTNRYYPQWVIETPNEHGVSVVRVPFWQRVRRYPLRLVQTALAGQWIWLLCQICYATGFIFGWLVDTWEFKATQRDNV